MLPANVHARIDTSTWEQGPVFDWLAGHGNIATDEMRRTFNCGVGMIVTVAASDADAAVATLAEHGETAWRIGDVAEGAGPVVYS